MSYSPHLRTAVLLSGNGTGGAYHAGVLRALHEAGVKIDVDERPRHRGCLRAVRGHRCRRENMGGRRRLAPASANSAVSDGAPLCNGRPCCRVAAVAVLAIPLLVLATGLVAYPLSFLVQMINVDAGFRLASAYTRHGALRIRAGRVADGYSATGDVVLCQCVCRARGGGACDFDAEPAMWVARRTRTARPSRSRAVVGAASSVRRGAPNRDCGIFAHRCGSCFAGPQRAKSRRRRTEPSIHRAVVRKPRAAWFSRADRGDARRRDTRRPRLCRDWRGAAAGILPARPRRSDRSERRRAQPGISTRWRRRMCRAGADRAALHRVLARELLERRGASHLRSDRRGARLLDELAAAGVEQVIRRVPRLGSLGAAPPDEADRLAAIARGRAASPLPRRPSSATRSRSHKKRFKGLFLIQPLHNPIGPLDFEGTYDERSDRNQSLDELMDRGYEDAYRQFIEPVVGGRGVADRSR